MLFTPFGEATVNGFISRKPGQAVVRTRLTRGQKYNFCSCCIAALLHPPYKRKMVQGTPPSICQKVSGYYLWCLIMMPCCRCLLGGHCLEFPFQMLQRRSLA